MKIAIVDNEKRFIEIIIDILKERYNVADIDCFTSLEDYRNSNQIYQLLLLDVELDDENGIDFIREMNQSNPYIIFISSYNKYIVDAFDYNVLGFVEKKDLKSQLINKMLFVEKHLNNRKVYEFELSEKSMIKVLEDDINYFELVYTSVILHLCNQQVLKLKQRSLKELDSLLSENFFRINRNICVNLRKINWVDAKQKLLELNEGQAFLISRRAWNDFKRAYNLVRKAYD